MASNKQQGLIFPSAEDKTHVLALQAANIQSSIGFVPITDARQSGLLHQFQIPDKDTPSEKTPLRLLGGQTIFLNKEAGYAVARALTSGTDDRMNVYIRRNNNNGVTLYTEDGILGFDRYGRLAYDLGTKVVRNGTASFYTMRPGVALADSIKWLLVPIFLLCLFYILFIFKRRVDRGVFTLDLGDGLAFNLGASQREGVSSTRSGEI
jgi:hypothetical protein